MPRPSPTTPPGRWWRSILRARRLDPDALPPGATLAFGTERDGLSDEVIARATAHVSIPMRAGVSSLNLATAVAVVLYTLGGPGPAGLH